VPGGDFTPAVGGESLDEHAAGIEEEVGGEAEDSVVSGGSKRLEEVVEGEDGEEGEDEEAAEPAEELLYDPEDDIVDSD